MDRKIISSVIGIMVLVSLFIGIAVLYFSYANTSEIDFFVLGDSQGYQGALDQVVLDANEEQPDFVMHCGDLTPFGREEQYEEVLDIIEPLSVPFYATPGNHDVRLDGRVIFEELFGPTNYSFDVGPIHFTVIDTSEGIMSTDQLNWLEADLVSAEAEYKVVFTHIPPFDPRPSENHSILNSTLSGYLMGLFHESDVDTVFTGHIHMYNQSVVQGVRYVITGGAGASVVASEENGGFYHYIHATLTANGLQIEPVILDAPTIDREHILLKGNEDDITLSISDLLSLDKIEGFTSFENQLGNWGGYGNYTGVKISTLLELVGGITSSQNLVVQASDGFEQEFCYSNVHPNASWYSYQGDMILAYQFNGSLVPDWTDGMRLVMLPEDGTYSIDDCLATSAQGQGCNIYSSAGARWVRYVSVIEVVDL